jgi:membrane protein EpsK
MTIRPIILLKYAQQDFSGLKQIASQSIRLLGWFLAIPTGLLCGFARPFLSLWLGSSFAYLDILLIIMVCHLGLNLCVRPLLRVQTAYNKIRWPGIATVITAVAFLVLASVVAKENPIGVAGVALISTISWTVRNTIYMPIYTARIMKLQWWAFFPDLFASIAGTLFVGLVSYAVTRFYSPDGWISLGISAVLVSLIYAVLVWFAGMRRSERRLVMSLVPIKKD